MDFLHDQLATGRKLRVLTIVDTFSRFSLALEPRFSFRGGDVVEVLERVRREIGLPGAIRVDRCAAVDIKTVSPLQLPLSLNIGDRRNQAA
jgi:hypothetical protein